MPTKQVVTRALTTLADESDAGRHRTAFRCEMSTEHKRRHALQGPHAVHRQPGRCAQRHGAGARGVRQSDGRLMPGQFARLSMGQPKAEQALLISERAVGTDQNKKFVMVVDEDRQGGIPRGQPRRLGRRPARRHRRPECRRAHRRQRPAARPARAPSSSPSWSKMTLLPQPRWRSARAKSDRAAVRERTGPTLPQPSDLISEARSPVGRAGTLRSTQPDIRRHVMNFSRFFIDRPIFAGVLSALIFLAGLLVAAGAADLGISRGRAADRWWCARNIRAPIRR